jgi:hypothetical protein
MSAEPEQLLSSTKITVLDRRNRLGSNILEAQQIYSRACISGIKKLTYWQDWHDWMARKAT